MNVENKFARFLRNSGPARVLVPIGLMLIIFGAILLGFKTDNYVETIGKITKVTEGIIEDGNQQYDVDVTYNVNGKDYTSTFSLPGKRNVGDDMKVYYDPEDPAKVNNTKMGGWLGPALIALGIIAAVFGIFKSVKAFQKSKELDRTAGAFPSNSFSGIKSAPGVKEYYFSFDGNSLKPGYIMEDADRNVLFEGKMLKNSLVGSRVFELNDHTTGKVSEHDVGHTVTQTFNNEFFSMKSWFKYDGENIWDVLHERGLRMATDIRSKFPKLVYNVARNGAPFAQIETSGMYVHEEDAAKHAVNLPVGRYYYRVWTDTDDLESLFLTVFAVSETEQTMVE